MEKISDYEEVLERWYRVTIPREELRTLMARSDLKGALQTVAHFGLLVGLGYLAYWLIGSWWMIPAFFAYGTVYCFLNHVMHETHHRTPFKTLWINEVVHWISAFAHGAEPVFDRWGHAQHHTYTYTYFPDNDPEVVTRRPANIPRILGQFFGIGIIKPIPIIRHAFGNISPRAKAIVPESDWNKMVWSSRLWLFGYAAIVASCFIFGSVLPLVFTLFARFYGAFIPTMLNDTQHIGLAENVYDHRLCTRDVYYSPVMSFLYWNMQYHIEHHMYPGIPFHSLKKAHRLVKSQLPEPYRNIWQVYREMIPTLLRQQKETDYHILPECPAAYPACAAGVLPESSTASSGAGSKKGGVVSDSSGRPKPADLDDSCEWIVVAESADLGINDVMPFSHQGKQYAIYRLEDGYYASSGKCTHAGALLARGLVISGKIECPAHQGRFDIRTGKATDSPACGSLGIFSVKESGGTLYLGLPKSGGGER